MLTRIAAVSMALLAGVPIGAWALSHPYESMLLSIRVIEGTGESQLLPKKSVVVPEGGMIMTISGGEWHPAEPGDTRQFGTHISGSLRDGGTRLSVRIDVSSPVSSDDEKSTVIRGEYIDLQATITPGVTSKLHCGGERWCEVTVERL